jgi:hypothetical protein
MFTNTRLENTRTDDPPAPFVAIRITPEKLRSLASFLPSDPHLAALARRFVEAQRALRAAGRA